MHRRTQCERVFSVLSECKRCNPIIKRELPRPSRRPSVSLVVMTPLHYGYSTNTRRERTSASVSLKHVAYFMRVFICVFGGFNVCMVTFCESMYEDVS